ncbi:YjfB family protein [Desulfolucanica intricata]|uniref:YjfB family protein n=1 Tax=Desulfolucanica intricata TaxID=1285191 RepID=UPI000835BD9F|nr:YjfB family protein [Desulfolucanica intricata]
MDIAALSILKSMAQVKQDAGVAVMKKAMDTAEQNGNFINRMLDNIPSGKNPGPANLPHMGSNLDVYA